MHKGANETFDLTPLMTLFALTYTAAAAGGGGGGAPDAPEPLGAAATVYALVEGLYPGGEYRLGVDAADAVEPVRHTVESVEVARSQCNAADICTTLSGGLESSAGKSGCPRAHGHVPDHARAHATISPPRHPHAQTPWPD